ncbi:DNA replication protein psf1 [Borealophlyctis nickersoniae]|nr:DNA replication protein psf1 [Borealophlyctis nickersoniae]
MSPARRESLLEELSRRSLPRPDVIAAHNQVSPLPFAVLGGKKVDGTSTGTVGGKGGEETGFGDDGRSGNGVAGVGRGETGAGGSRPGVSVAGDESVGKGDGRNGLLTGNGGHTGSSARVPSAPHSQNSLSRSSARQQSNGSVTNSNDKIPPLNPSFARSNSVSSTIKRLRDVAALEARESHRRLVNSADEPNIIGGSKYFPDGTPFADLEERPAITHVTEISDEIRSCESDTRSYAGLSFASPGPSSRRPSMNSFRGRKQAANSVRQAMSRTPLNPISYPSIEQRFAELPQDIIEMIQIQLGPDIDLQDLFQRLNDTELNVLNGRKGFGSGTDYTRPILGRYDVVKRAFRVLGRHIRVVGGILHIGKGKRRANSETKDNGGDDESAEAGTGAAVGSGQTTTGVSHVYPPSVVLPIQSLQRPADFPDPPPDLDTTDPLQLAIHYHEQDLLPVSFYYLQLSAAEGNPLGLFLIGISLRHGLGTTEDQPRAVRCLIRAAEAAVVSIPAVLTRYHNLPNGQSWSASNASLPPSLYTPPFRSLSRTLSRQPEVPSVTLPMQIPSPPQTGSLTSVGEDESAIRQQQQPHAQSLLRQPSLSSTPSKPPTPNSLHIKHSTLPRPTTPTTNRVSPTPPGHASAAQNSASPNPDLTLLLHILPLPLHELAICFQQGWGTPRSNPAAVYFFRCAAAMGDVDACVSYADCLLAGRGVKRDKREAGKWLRRAKEGGREVIGESWIWKGKPLLPANMSTYGEDAVKLVRDAKRMADAPGLPPYRDDLVRDTLLEMRHLSSTLPSILKHREELLSNNEHDAALGLSIAATMHHLSLKRSKRCLLAYSRARVDRLTDAVWELGGAAGGGAARLPADIRKHMSPAETEFASEYANLVAAYKGSFLDVDLGAALVPPRDLFIEVRVVKDCGEVMTESGPVRLVKDSQHYLRRTDVEGFITAGYLRHIE